MPMLVGAPASHSAWISNRLAVVNGLSVGLAARLTIVKIAHR